MMTETWLDIQGFEGEYEISNTGKVKSKKHKNEKILIPEIDRYGYLRVTLSHEGRQYKKKIHRLVAETFLSNDNTMPQVNHKDGNKANNNVDNLEWCSAKENLQHALDIGLRQAIHKNTPHYGESNGRSKITKEIVEEMRKVCIPGDKEYGIRALARKYGISSTAANAIINNKTWKEEIL